MADFSIIFQILNLLIFLVIVLVLLGLIIVLAFFLILEGLILPFGYYYHIGKSAIYAEIPYDESIDHTAIIVIVYSRRYFYKRFFVYLSGVELLTKGLKKLDEPYVLYRCPTPQRFIEIINKETAKRIWIIGHGVKHGVSFGKEILYYCEVGEAYKKTKNAPKEYVKQLHCNEYGGKSLIDYICDNKEKSFVTDNARSWHENRKYIIDTLDEMKKK